MHTPKRWPWVVLTVIGSLVIVSGSLYFAWVNWHLPQVRGQTLWTLALSSLGVAVSVTQLLAHFRNVRLERHSNAASRFDHTIQAQNFMREQISPKITTVRKRFERSLHANQTGRSQSRVFNNLLLTESIRTAGFAAIFKDLNQLAAYTHYHMVNPLQLYSNIADDVLKLTTIAHFEQIQHDFQRRYLMNNYEDLLAEITAYVNAVKPRRPYYDEKDLHHR